MHDRTYYYFVIYTLNGEYRNKCIYFDTYFVRKKYET